MLLPRFNHKNSTFFLCTFVYFVFTTKIFYNYEFHGKHEMLLPRFNHKNSTFFSCTFVSFVVIYF
jgi:hypothetical protein